MWFTRLVHCCFGEGDPRVVADILPPPPPLWLRPDLCPRAVTLAAVIRKECVGHHGEGKGKAIVFMSTCDAVDFYFKV